MVRPGLINLDFADVRAVMDEMGKAMMGTGEAEGPDRATHAAEKAIANPLLDEISLKGAKGVLINITGGYDMTLFELDEAANKIREMVDEDANIIVGSTLDTDMGGKMRVSVVATGIDASASRLEPPMPRRSMSAPGRVDEQPQRVAAPQPSPMARTVAPQAQPVARQPAPQPAPPPRPAPEPIAEERSFEPRAYEEPEAADDLPPPAYRPTPAPVQRAEPMAEAASRPAPGTPTPEALARLRAMANRAADAQRGGTQGGAAAPQGDKPRFGINSLINRMTGQPAGENQTPPPAAAAGGAAPAPRPQPRYEAQPDAEQERADIPAFLRRQAN
jgi:cell division protein FtsZ